MDFKRLFDNWENRKNLEAGTVIFRENDPADAVYVILSGKVQLSIKDEVLGTEEAGGIIGEMAIVNPTAHNSTAVALTPLVLAQLDQKQFSHLIRNEPEFSLHAMAVLANRLRAVDSYISSRLD
jgi:CRP-like cAMP-binding protein